MGIVFLHTADWQLGKPFNNFGPETGPLLRRARIGAVRTIAQLARERRADAVLVAGDVFDEQLVSPEVITGCLGAMCEFDGDWVLLPGNHDAAAEGSVWDKVRLRLPPGSPIHLATTPEPIILADGEMAVLPAPLTRRHEAEDVTAVWDNLATPPAAFRVGLAHGSVLGILPESPDSPNPIAPNRASRAHLDYLALGDWHGRFQISERAWYSGTPEPDTFKGNNPGHVLWVQIANRTEPPRVESIATGEFTWRDFSRSIQSFGDWELQDRDFGQLGPVDHQIVKLRLEGVLPIADWQTLQTRLEWWRGQFAALRVEQDQLRTSASAGDFARLQSPGYVARAVEELLRLQGVGDGSASAALQLLYQLCAEAEALP